MMKLNFWESFAVSVAISVLQALIAQQSKLTPDQKTDLQAALGALQKVQADFSV